MRPGELTQLPTVINVCRSCVRHSGGEHNVQLLERVTPIVSYVTFMYTNETNSDYKISKMFFFAFCIVVFYFQEFRETKLHIDVLKSLCEIVEKKTK